MKMVVYLWSVKIVMKKVLQILAIHPQLQEQSLALLEKLQVIYIKELIGDRKWWSQPLQSFMFLNQSLFQSLPMARISKKCYLSIAGRDGIFMKSLQHVFVWHVHSCELRKTMNVEQWFPNYLFAYHLYILYSVNAIHLHLESSQMNKRPAYLMHTLEKYISQRLKTSIKTKKQQKKHRVILMRWIKLSF